MAHRGAFRVGPEHAWRSASCADKRVSVCGGEGSPRQKSETSGTEPGAFEEQGEEHVW